MKILGLLKVSRGESLDRIYLLKLFGYGIFLHKIHSGGDPAGLYHNHPWNGLSIIFGNYYEFFLPERYEETPFTSAGIHYPVHKRWFINWIKATRHHRVVVKRTTWTLFMHGRKCNTWEIVDDKGRKVEKPWEGAEGVKSYTKAAA